MSELQLCLRDGSQYLIKKPLIMGIINVSPNSFFNPHHSIDAALKTAEQFIQQGADILDIGGEATNPQVEINPSTDSTVLEIERVVTTVEAIKQRFDVLISVDTSRTAVIYAAAEAGADIINDQRSLKMEGALSAAAKLQLPVCLMHWFENRKPASTTFETMLTAIKSELKNNINRCLQAGILPQRIIIDPGFGQGHYNKNCAENFYLLSHLSQLVNLGYPVLTGWSRKSMIGDVLGLNPQERLYGSIAADTLAVYHGASIIRTHDVRAAKEAAAIAKQALSFH